jgi:hypothetical protein
MAAGTRFLRLTLTYAMNASRIRSLVRATFDLFYAQWPAPGRAVVHDRPG